MSLLSKEAFMASGLPAAGGAAASIIARQLQKSETIAKYKYGIPIATFVIGHVVADKVHKGAGHGICAVAGFQLAEMMQNESAQQKQQFYGEASGYGTLPAGYPQYAYAYTYPQYATP